MRCIVPVVSAPERSALDSLTAEGRVDAEPLPDAERLFFAKATYDVGTGRYAASFPGDFLLPSTDDVLAVVAFWSFPEEGFLQALRGIGIEPLEPAPYMGYLVGGPRDALERAARERTEVRSVVPLPLGLKWFGFEQEADPSPAHEASTTVTLARAREGTVLALLAAREGRTPVRGVAAGPTASYTVTLTRSEAELLATYPDVISVRRNVVPATPSDERFNRIVAGGFQSLDASWPAGPWPLSIGSDPEPSMPANAAPYHWDGYLSQLSALGGGTFDPANQTIGFVDSGIDSGLRRQGADYCPTYLRPPGFPTAPCRLVFTADETAWHDSPDLRADDRSYHGTIVTSIAAGLASADSSGRDTGGYAFTQGVASEAKVAVCRFFRSCQQDENPPDTWRLFPGGDGPFNDTSFDPRLRYALVEMSATGALPDNVVGPGAQLFNHSWNMSTDVGYEQTSRVLDVSARRLNAISFAYGTSYGSEVVHGASGATRPALHVVSAGNVNASGDIVTAPAVAKNALAIGAFEGLNQEGYVPGNDPACGGRNDAFRADRPAEWVFFSRTGWPNLRAKPDLVAPGTRAYGRRSVEGSSTCSQAACNMDITGTGQYAWTAGTSFSAPVVAGAAALVREWLRTTGRTDPSPALLKSILIGSSRKLRSCNTGCPCGSSDDVRPAPDEYQGWGGVDLSRLFRPASNYYLHDQTTTLTPQSQPWTKDLVITDLTKDVVVTVVWTDRHSLDTVSSVDNLVNDLSLSVEIQTTGGKTKATYLGNYFYDVFHTCSPPYRDGYSWPDPGVKLPPDHKNNVEKVYVKASDLAAFGVTRLLVSVFPYSITADGMDPDSPAMLFRQDFAIYVENAHE